MALQKQNVNINFAQGLDTKTDPNQVSIGKFLTLQNSIFTKMGRLTKRNGFGYLPSLPDTTNNAVTTFKDNLIALGTNLNEFSPNSGQWLNKGYLNAVGVSVNPVVRTTSAQLNVDVSVTSGSFNCVVWKDLDGNNYYQIVDTNSGNIVLASGSLEAGSASPRTFLLGNNFIVSYLVTVSGTVRLHYIAIPIINPTNPGSPKEVSNQVSSLGAAYDAVVVANANIYFAWNGSDVGGAIRISWIDSNLIQHFTTAYATENANLISVTNDATGGSPVIWVSYVNSANALKALAINQLTGPVLAPTTITTGLTVTELTSAAQHQVLTCFYQNTTTYSYSATRSDNISSVTLTQAGSPGSPSVILRSVGITSKAFIFNGVIYLLSAYGGSFQPTYFLINSSGQIVSKLAYANGGGYATDQILSNATVYGSTVTIGYLFKDFIVPINKNQGASTVGNTYTQTGVNIVEFTFQIVPQAVEIANSLIINGGLVRMYDGIKPVELNFNVWPEDLAFTTATTGGFLAHQLYNYVATYEWTDSQGNIHVSAPSVPLVADITSSGTNTNTITVNVPTLRLTYKTGKNSVRIVLYRWSVAQQTFYQVTSISMPIANSTTVDSISFVDTLADSSIIGNQILYTTGGVVENIAPPPTSAMTMHKSRLFLLDAEDENLVWYSKIVLETTPVEMSDFFTLFLAPTISASGNTGTAKTLYSMDDKLIAFKKDIVYYLTGNGPDNTGANNDFSDFTPITSTVGCTNAQSLAFTPNGIMFQSDKGIWILGRDLSTSYIGAPVEGFNSANVLSALTVPGTNQVRFTLDSGSVLMYDYYFNQWGEFKGIPALSSAIFQGLHTFINTFGQVLQETPNLYVDGSSPVIMNFVSAWIPMSGLQGFERAYHFYLLATYLTPHKIQVQLAYDYNPSPTQTSVISPDNFAGVYGSDPIYGGQSPYGGPSQVEQWRVFLQTQKCEAFQILLTEMYDSSFGVAAGPGFTLSGINVVYGQKKGYFVLPPARSVG